ncbi:hypothetical protein JMF89_04080 [Clostridiaceae bacterium UIB06]|uniref:Uncharacterized protein n=1 Tax=Clostridium thailandense TaxID=2794346 RepID=A0A949X2S0_9CLOT|nr:hypothetical protein [Clostridium thailandense]MBV7271638.1 hypothetical protein [Clostridium thailandense]MCH5136392.1 hypothetical protein [Clostridiaceae bacterium UIB06]
MKNRFVKVWDDRRFGYMKYIVLEVEKNDKFLLEAGFDPGYKFIIQAVYDRVGAAGGHEFNPYYGERVRKISHKINSTEADVLGFYLQNVDNIYDIPNTLYTENIWNVVRTDGYCEEDDDYDAENCYKVLLASLLDTNKASDCLFIDKETLEVVSGTLYDHERSITKYLWSSCEELPDELLEEVKEKNSNHYFGKVYNLMDE